MNKEEYLALTKKTKKHKYNAKSCVIDGIRFDSLKEGRRYTELKLLEHAGIITELSLQPSFKLQVNGVLICKYIGDFKYLENGELIIEDVKGVKTREFRLKQKLMKAIHDIEITIT